MQLKGCCLIRDWGSGIKRALEDWQDISFTDDREGSMFIATVHRKVIEVPVEEKESQKSTQKSTQKIIELMRDDPTITIADLALRIGITEGAIKKQIRKMKAQGRIQRIVPDKGGHWQVAE
jgi:ATP-dependent DNA helicase RecG